MTAGKNATETRENSSSEASSSSSSLSSSDDDDDDDDESSDDDVNDDEQKISMFAKNAKTKKKKANLHSEWSPPNGGGTGEYPQKRIQD